MNTNQRVLSQTKHLSKRLSTASLGTDGNTSSNPNLQSTQSLTRNSSSSSCNKFLISSFSTSSLKQFDLQHLISSSLASNTALFKSRSSASMGNESWEFTSTAKTTTTSLDMIGLSDVKISRTKPNAFLGGSLDVKVSSSPSVSSLQTRKEEVQATPKNQENETWSEQDALYKDTSAYKIDDRFKAIEVSKDHFLVKTFTEKPSKQMDIRSVDLNALKEEDAFMYYSIPEIRKAALQGEEIDLEDLNMSTQFVTRSNAISFESADVISPALGSNDEANPNEGPNFTDAEDDDLFHFLADFALTWG